MTFDTPAPPLPAPAPGRRPMVLLLGLILLADLLFWRETPGLSLALFAVALFAASLASPPRLASPPSLAAPPSLATPPRLAALVTLTLALLPVVEYVQPLSLAILGLGLLASLALQHGAPLSATISLATQIPTRAARDPGRASRSLQGQDIASQTRRFGRNWTLPLGGLLLLIALLAEANPVLDTWLQDVADLPFDPALWVERLLFWTGTALLVWPLVVAMPTAPPSRTLSPLNPAAFGLNAASVANALILFNIALAVQTLLDARYLWAGTTPPGMSLAAYAHRGAYPLLATALLAGAFALAARPFVATRPLLKPLLHLWLAQNILLTLSALYRLDLYVRTCGLTYLRAHAAIWMALVALGLTLTLWQVARNHSATWLLLRCAALGTATLYLAAFVNFADLIARTNIAVGKIDTAYLCALGPTAAASVPRLAWQDDDPKTDRLCTLTPPHIDGWRDWGFRNWRVLNSLAQQEVRP